MQIKNRPVLEMVIPLLFIFIFEVVSIRLYILSQSKGVSNFFITWIISQTLGGILLGYFSDKFQRKRILILSQIFAAGILAWVIFSSSQEFSLFSIGLLGLVFNATPAARASLVDNFPHYSRNHLLCYSFLVQFLPWCFFPYAVLIQQKTVFLYVFFLLLLNATLTFFLFKDQNIQTIKYERFIKTIAKQANKRSVFPTVFALFIGQLVFFIADFYIEHRSPSPSLYGILGLGSFIGSGMGLVYRKIPHLSLLTMSYGFGFLISAVTFASLFFYKMNISETVILFQVTLYASLGGFYLPLVYETVLSAISFKIRGYVCGLIELTMSLSAFIALWSILDKLSIFGLLSISTLLFLLALIIQKRGESHA